MALPPTSTKISGDANEVTTFKFDFPNFTGTHTGTQLSLGVNSVVGGGTGLATLTANSVLIGNGTSNPTFVAPGTSGNVLTSNGTVWSSQAPSGGGTSPVYWSGYHDGIYQWSVTGGGLTNDFTSLTVGTFAQRTNSGFGTVTTAGSSLPGITFTPTSNTAAYLITVSASITNDSGNQTTIMQLTDGSSVISTGNFRQAGVATAYTQVTMTSIYIPGTTSPVTIKLQGGVGAGTGYINSALGTSSSIEWSIEQISAPSTSAVSSLAAFGSTPNANGLTLSGSTLNMQPASSSQPGGVSTTTQTFAGAKTLGAIASEAQTIGAASSTSIQTINGGNAITTRTTSSNLTLDTTTTDRVILCQNSAAIAITLTAATTGRVVTIKDAQGSAGVNNITITPNGGETIDGAASLIINSNYGSIDLIGLSGTGWFII